MMETIQPYPSIFDNYEAREAAFRELVDFKLARRSAGPAQFWKDFGRITRRDPAVGRSETVAYITSNPRDCLAFGTPRQVLMAALMVTAKKWPGDPILEVASRFGIAGQLDQPIRTLSGGETVKLALAKTRVSLKTLSHAVVSSPFAWLSANNRYLLDDLADHCRQPGKKLSLLFLEGEDNLAPIGPEDPYLQPLQQKVAFSLLLRAVKIPLTLTLNPLAANRCYAAIESAELQLVSPCVITGNNGQGKSLVARAVAGALTFRGSTSVIGPMGGGKGALLFQDVLTQALLRSFSTLIRGGPGMSRPAIVSIYEKIREAYAAACSGIPTDCPGGINAPEAARHNLRDIKAALVAVRLAKAPAALILDEPDWGLSRQSAIAFVSAVLSVAHAQGTPVILISHKPWWQTIACSGISISRSPTVDPVAQDGLVFTISLRAVRGAP
jgi:ABC-type transport system involved in cytochrome c biogenesis ATPase subunit